MTLIVSDIVMKKMKEQKPQNLIVDHFLLTFVNLSLTWMLYSMYDFRIKGKFWFYVDIIKSLAYINFPVYLS